VQIHCHQHAVLDPQAERRVLDRLGLDCEVLPSGCCGMAGSFGFEAGKYRWSRKIAESGVLPQLARAEPDALVLADGFSCREQIEGLSGRRTRHMAEILALSLGFAAPRDEAAGTAKAALAAGGILTAGAVLGALFAYRSRGVRAALFGAASSTARNPARQAAPATASPR
jgi:hypothetical protein